MIGVDLSEAMLRIGQKQRSRLRWLLPFLPGRRPALLAADAAALPFKPQSIDLLWSNLLLHWLDDPLQGFRKAAYRLLEIDGLLMFSTFGPDTLKELRASFWRWLPAYPALYRHARLRRHARRLRLRRSGDGRGGADHDLCQF
ncbi:methyltransferase domain-containing protein [Accumulibacter sp.]|uniref:methyltransferase domain-containing protein n=1 Tax=Accumulibacter sp. TaxID=2053492 RepID=UPI00338EDCA3